MKKSIINIILCSMVFCCGESHSSINQKGELLDKLVGYMKSADVKICLVKKVPRELYDQNFNLENGKKTTFEFKSMLFPKGDLFYDMGGSGNVLPIRAGLTAIVSDNESVRKSNSKFNQYIMSHDAAIFFIKDSGFDNYGFISEKSVDGKVWIVDGLYGVDVSVVKGCIVYEVLDKYVTPIYESDSLGFGDLSRIYTNLKNIQEWSLAGAKGEVPKLHHPNHALRDAYSKMYSQGEKGKEGLKGHPPKSDFDIVMAKSILLEEAILEGVIKDD